MKIEDAADRTKHRPSVESQVMAKLIKEAQQRQRGEPLQHRIGKPNFFEENGGVSDDEELITRAWNNKTAGKDPRDRYLQIHK